MSFRAISRFPQVIRSLIPKTRPAHRRPLSRESIFRHARIESLETRQVFAAPTLINVPDTVTVGAGAPLQIALDGADADNDQLTYSVQITNSNIQGLTATLRQGSMVRMNVNHASSGPSDPALSGTLVFKLFEDLAPRTTTRFKNLINSDFYDGVIFHRIIDDFMMQGGDPSGTGSGGSNLGDFDDEYNPLALHTSAGLLSLAKSTDDSNDSQFFITDVATRSLDFQHTVFGMLVEGDALRNQLTAVPTNAQDRPLGATTITSMEVLQDRENGVLTIHAPEGATGTATITVTVSDGNGGTVQRTIQVTMNADPTNSPPHLVDGDNPQKIETAANTTTTVQLTANDVDNGGAIKYYDLAAIMAESQEFNPPDPNLARFRNSELIRKVTSNPNVTWSVNPTTGLLTVTPKNNFAGVQNIIVGVANSATNQSNSNQIDTQIIPVYVDPPAPQIDLLDESDTGISDEDNITGRDNTAGKALKFSVTNLIAGAKLKLMAGTTVLFEGTVPQGQTSMTVTTNGTAALANGVHSIIARQALENQQVNAGNFTEIVTLTSPESQAISLTVDTNPPTFSSTPVVKATPTVAYSYNVQSPEEGTTGFLYELTTKPEGATINQATGVISWTPSLQQVATHQFVVRATDAAGNSNTQAFSVKAGAEPVFPAIPNKGVVKGEQLKFTTPLTDDDLPNDTLTFSLVNGPTGAAVNATSTPGTVEFVWTPGDDQLGTQTIRIKATDAYGLSSEKTFTVFVVNQAAAPMLGAIADATVNEHATYSLQATATDTNLPNDTLKFEFVGTAPPGMTMTPTGLIMWTPTEEQGRAQGYVATVRVTDAFGLSDAQSFTITVNETNTPPTIGNIPNQTATEGELLTFTVTADDTDVPPQTPFKFRLAGTPPAGATINESTGVFTWTPTAQQVGVHDIIIEVEDSGGAPAGPATSQRTVRVTVGPKILPYIVANGILTVNGTAGDDTLTIKRTANFGEYQLSGSLGNQTLSGIINGIVINLDAGNDQLALASALVNGDITINTGAGSDHVRLGAEGLVSGVNLNIMLGDDDDSIRTENVVVKTNQTIEGGAGRDYLALIGATGAGGLKVGLSSGGDTRVNGSGGNDIIDVANSAIVGALTVDGGAGADSIMVRTSSATGNVVVVGGTENDTLTVDGNFFTQHLMFDGGGGQDRLSLRNSIGIQTAGLLGGFEDDTMEMVNSIVRQLWIDGGAGQDRVETRTAIMDSLFGQLGDGDDTLNLQFSLVNGWADFDGGVGMDRVTETGSLVRGFNGRRGFEFNNGRVGRGR